MIFLHSRMLYSVASSAIAMLIALPASAIESLDPLGGAHDCMIEPFITANVGSSTQGIVVELLAERGSTVKSGEAIVKLESSMELAAMIQAEARSEMLGEVVSREADLELASLDAARFSELYKKGLAPEQQRDEALARRKIASAALAQALENQKLLLLELRRTRSALEQRTIKSPVDGVVVNQLVFPGELVFDNPVMTVAQLDPLRVEVVLPARLFGTIKAGDSAQIYSEIEIEEPLFAEVDVVDPLLDSRSGTFGVRLALPNADFAVPAGQKCRISFVVVEEDLVMPAAYTAPSAYEIPDANEKPGVYETPVGIGAAMPPHQIPKPAEELEQ